MRLAPLVIVVLGAGVARADGERALSVGVSWATYSALGKPVGKQAPPTLSPDAGGMLIASYEVAISADVALRGELAGGVFHGGNQAMQSAWSYASLGDAGAVFRFDVVKVVPYLFGGVGGVVSGGGPIDRGVDFVLVAGGGVDWLYSRERSIGAEVRIASFGGDITLATFGVRGTLRWGDL